MKEVKYYCDICNSEKTECQLTDISIEFGNRGIHNKYQESQVCYECQWAICSVVSNKIKELKTKE